MIAERVVHVVMSGQRVYKPSSFRASEAGHLCARYHYHCMADWDQRPTPDEKLAHIFRLGQHLEEYALKLLAEAGIKVVKSQVAAEDKDLGVVGHIDGFVVLDGEEIPIEIKSVAEHHWEKIRSYGDLLSDDAPWLTRWAAQLPLYMYLHACERGLYLLINKQTGELKEVGVTLDEAMPLLERVQDVLVGAKKALADSNPPSPAPSSIRLCAYCWAKQVGLCPGPPASPEVMGEEAIREATEAAATIVETREAHKRYEDAQKRLRSSLSAVKPDPGTRLEMFLGSVPVRITGVLSTTYDIPEEIRSQYAVKKPTVRVEVL